MSVSKKQEILSGEPIISIAQAKVRHVNKILFEELTFQVKKGEHWAILGDSGSGKTALLHTLEGKFNITNGTRYFPFVADFKTTHQISDPLFSHRQLTAFVSQQAQFKNKENQHNFFYQQRFHAHFSEEAETVETYIKKAEVQLAQSLKPIKFSTEWLIENLQLTSLLPKTLIQLSNGETRRLQVAYALLEQPVLLLMDNPLIGLDHATRPILKDILDKISDKECTLVMATTSREIPESITHIVYLKNQEIEYAGPKEGFEIKDENPVQISWEPDPEIRAKIKTLEPHQNHDFTVALDMEDIHVKSSGKIILEGVNWKVKKGEKWSLLGPNGAGKSTLLSLLNGDHPQSYANKITLFDRRRGTGESIWEVKKRIGYISPEMHQYFRGNNTVLMAILSGLDDTMGFRNKPSKEEEITLANYWLQLLEMGDIAEQPFKDLATGTQRLVLLIRAMIKNPPLLILDEPCQGLDQNQRAHFKHLVNILWQSNEKTLLYVSHYKEDIPSCVHHILALENGRPK